MTKLRVDGVEFANANARGDFVQTTANLQSLTIPWSQVTGGRVWTNSVYGYGWRPGTNGGGIGNCGNIPSGYHARFEFEALGGNDFLLYWNTLNCTDCNCACNC